MTIARQPARPEIRQERVGSTAECGIHPSGSWLYVSNNTDNVVHVIDTSTLGEIGTIPSGGTQAQTMILNAGASVMYVANTAGNSVGVIDLPMGALLGTIPVGNNPLSLTLTPDGTRLYVPNSGLVRWRWHCVGHRHRDEQRRRESLWGPTQRGRRSRPTGLTCT